jgi:hypothetical protein
MALHGNSNVQVGGDSRRMVRKGDMAREGGARRGELVRERQVSALFFRV